MAGTPAASVRGVLVSRDTVPLPLRRRTLHHVPYPPSAVLSMLHPAPGTGAETLDQLLPEVET
ncbi:hypothetical protein AAIH32_08390 [Pseudarthrobacter oxydans]|uniref:hypothetical protein n=1 Tax=Pseudarthrobacter oxydans TaxID=1671 RepID=UPI003D291782